MLLGVAESVELQVSARHLARNAPQRAISGHDQAVPAIARPAALQRAVGVASAEIGDEIRVDERAVAEGLEPDVLGADADRLEVLLDDRLEERGHEFVGRHAGLLQAVDVRLREHPAFARDGMQLQPLVAHLAKLLGRDLELGVDLVDDRAGAAGALVVH